MLAGYSLLSIAQIPGPIRLQGIGGNSIQEIDVPQLGTGGSIQTVNVPVVGTCSNCITYLQDSYIVHAFTVTGTTTFTPPAGLTSVEVLIVGGGGGGGGAQYGGGGGGAGGLRWLPAQAVSPPTAINVTVGTGGNGGTTTTNGSNGVASSFGAASASGGGGGGRGDTGTASGVAGGSGGGGGGDNSNTAGTRAGGAGNSGAYTPVEGFAGAAGATSTTTNIGRGGGGGGAGGTGGTGNTANGGAGGIGKDYSTEFGTSFGQNGWFAGGGGGGKRTTGAGGVGGTGGGGNGGVENAGGTAAQANTGGGGGGVGGNGTTQVGGAGGSGIVLVRYIPPLSAQQRVVHTFTASGTFTPPAGLASVDVLVVAGGGGGGFPTDRTGGGGGAGGLIYNTGVAVGAPVTVTVGAGGNGATGAGGATAGSNSVFGALTAIGGGRGGTNGVLAGTGGSGGGGYHNPSDSGKAGTVGQGNAGSSGYDSGNVSIGFKAGGGGGAGGAGTTPSTTTNGNGGAGALNGISGTVTAYAGGGGGGVQVYTVAALGGSGVGGNGGADGSAGTAGASNRGGGGGGGSQNIGTGVSGNGGNGGSGIVIVSYAAPTVKYVVHTYTSSGTFTPPPGVGNVEVLVVGGGGGGGSARGFGSAGAGGGGAGGLVYNNNFSVSGAVSVTVGAGGPGGPGAVNVSGSNGSDSVFGTLTALGGGGGFGGNGQGLSGGSGGGSRGANGGVATQPGSASGGFGFRAGNIPLSDTGAGASGGGGAGATGQDRAGTANEPGGAGGNGLAYDISGTSTYYAGGGGGGAAQNLAAVGAGGLGGGGAGGRTDTAATAGTANTGGGGGGGNNAVNGASGGSGVVIVRYRPPTMVITTQPSTTAISGYTLAQQPKITLLSATGTPLNNIPVTAAIDTGTGTLGGTLTVSTNASGEATFSNLAITGSAGTFRLRFTAAGSNDFVVSNNITLSVYHIEISHAPTASVCTSYTPLTLSVRNASNALVTNFAGVVSLANSGNHGNYAAGTGAVGMFSNGGGNGTAQYTFNGSEGGQVQLNYSTSTVGTITFGASSGSIALANYSINLNISGCAFRIGTDLNGNVCTAENVAITAVDGSGNTIPTFTGTITLATSSLQGAWAQGSANGTLVPGGGNGAASYTFSTVDAGVANLSFLHPTVNNDVNINATFGSYVDDPANDNHLNIVACTSSPSLFAQSCTNASNTTTISIPLASSNSGRLALVTVHRTGDLGNPGPTASATTFNGSNMTLLQQSYINNGTADLQTQVYGLLDASLPAGPGPYTVTASANATTRICVLIYQNVDQTALALPPPFANSLVLDNAGTNITTTLGAIVQTFTANNLTGFVPPVGVTQFDALLVGGGGGGGGYRRGGGGGGGGGVRWISNQAVSGTYPVVIGTSGNGGSNNATTGNGASGGLTSLGSLQVAGGGGGMRGDQTTGSTPAVPANGGSGGGGGSTSDGGANAGANGSTYGNNGAAGGTATATNDQSGGGGGGAGSNGTAGSNTSGGAGGAGLDVSAGIYNLGTGFGANGVFGGGGGGGKRATETAGAGGTGGGGAGGLATTGSPGTANTGGGGGGIGSGTAASNAAAAGGTGFVLVRYIDPATLTGNALLVSAVSARLPSGTRNWSNPPDSDLSTRLWSGNNGNLSFGVSDGYVSSPGSITVTDSHDGANTDRRTQILVAFRPAAAVLHHFNITHSGTGGTCSANAVTITAIDQYGAVLEGYTGTITLSAGGTGSWSQGTANNTPANGTPGVATYIFHGNDHGVATLGYSRATANATQNFNVSANAGSIVESAFFDANMNIGSCAFRISHSGTGSICSSTAVTITAVDAAGNTLPFYTGTVNITTALVPGPGNGGGTWSNNTSINNVVDTTPGDGIASYTFASGDNGVVVLNFTKLATGTVNINLSATGMVEAPAYDPALVIGNCYFRISYIGGDSTTDVCSLKEVIITAVNGAGATLTGYTGTVNITTSTGKGDWSAGVATNAVNNFGSGSASYQFHANDNGQVTLKLSHNATAASVNINLNSGSFQEDPAYDPHLSVGSCTFRINVVSPATACTASNVTLSVYDSDNLPATDYAGTVSLTTTTAHGTWVSTTGVGALVDSSPDNGTGTYTFVNGPGGDMGAVVLSFNDTTVETVNISATANNGAITVDTNYDPPLTITACLPSVFDSACYANNSQASAIDLRASGTTLASRMVLLYVNSESLTTTTGATINGVTKNTPLRREIANFGLGNVLEVYAWLDTELPPNAGTYAASFTGGGAGPAMCIVAVEGVAQAYPLEAVPATNGQLNGSNTQSLQKISTSITTLQNNSIVFSVAANGTDGTTYASSLSTSLWTPGVADAASGDWTGNYGYQLTTGALTVEEEASVLPNRQVHIALALAPKVLGDPAVTGYVPVKLFRTISGNVNYRATGNSIRQFANGSFACVMYNAATGSTATINLPTGSTVKAAYLYWAGSGGNGYSTPPGPIIDTQVTFGVNGGTEHTVDADGTFLIVGPFGEPEEFFANYKDVTGLVSANPTTTYRLRDLVVDVRAPWATFSTCVGGWALVVVYENPLEDLHVINLFHGFQPFWKSSFTLVPRNFRMATPNGVDIPRGQITHITFEGDNFDGTPAGCTNGVNCTTGNLNTADEVFELQNNPNLQTFNALNNPFNTVAPGISRQYNDTVSYPLYNSSLKFDSSQGNSGYFGAVNSYGTDVDTYYIQGAIPGEILYQFGANESEQITTRYSAGQDIVLLLGEFISVTNAPIADLEVFVSSPDTFRVDTDGQFHYEYSVKNNGNGALSGGYASGDVILTGNMPNGITIDHFTGAGWNCSLATTTAFTCIFEIANSWTTGLGAATNYQLASGEYLPTLNVFIDTGNETAFPLLDNEVTTIARLSHVGDYTTCPAEPAGVQPDPNPASGCNRAPQFDNVNDLNKFLIDIDNINEKQVTNNNVHHNIRIVKGLRTDLGITKSVTGILEANEAAHYALTVTNYGPDNTTKVITVTDVLPAGLVPLSAVGTNWSCGISVQTVTCTRSTALNVGNSSVINITTGNISAPAVEGSYVSNTATVSIAAYNFDTVGANNSATDISQVTGPLAAATERFLMSVSEDGTSINGSSAFNEGDIFIYDPVSDTAQMYLAESSIPGITDLGNINALHVLPNGWVILSTSTPGSSINGISFNPEDLVLYDPILQTATLIFDGSAIFAGAADIDAVYVDYHNSYDPMDWDIVLSTADTATIGATTFQDNDIVIYNMTSGLVSSVLDGFDDDLFDGTGGDISALYRRSGNSSTYVLATSDASVTIGNSGEVQQFEGGELVEINLSTPNDPTTDPLLCDDQTPCVGSPPAIFGPVSATRQLDAVHLVESTYFGHFAITSAGGDTCSATAVTISKHAGLTHTVEAQYQGSIIVSSNLAQGTWAKDATANGTIMPISPGVARYTFAPGDNGQVILFITDVAATTSFNVNVSNTPTLTSALGKENSPTEDANIIINNLVTVITYSDQFSAIAYNNNDGVASFASAWTETNDGASGPASGKVSIVTGGASPGVRFHNQGGGSAPELVRTIDFSSYNVSQPPVLSFNWKLSGAPSGSFAVEARGNSGDSWTTLQTFTTPLNPTFGSVNYTLTQAPYNLILSSTTQIRFLITSGYTASANDLFTVDNVQISTETNDCGVGGTIDHYSITHSGSMVSCLVAPITISPHTVGELLGSPTPGTVITLNTSSSKGTWAAPIGGTGAFSSVAGTGQATYTYQLGEDELVFPLNYTNVTGASETFTITVQDNGVPAKSQLENQTLTAAKTGLRFFNDTASNEIFPTLVAGMPSNVLYPTLKLTVQAIQASTNNPAVCEAIFGNGQDVAMELAFECSNPLTCSADTIPVQVSNNSNTVNIEPVDDDGISFVNVGGFKPVTLRFTTQTGGDYGGGTYSGAELVLNYADAGALQIHGRYNIELENGVGNLSGDYMQGSGANSFVVRPFAYDIDFSLDRKNNGNDSDATSWATNAAGSKFFAAGANFNTTVRAVAWELADDADNNGIADNGANLYDNLTTPNYGNEIVTSAGDLTITHALNPVMPMGSVAGTLDDSIYIGSSANFRAAWNAGVQTQAMSYSEVGIIDLTATIDSGDYLGGGQSVTSTLSNVGRFIPDHFTYSANMLTARPLFTPSASTFTYMGEEFTAWFTLTARASCLSEPCSVTQNYFGAFAKLNSPSQLNFYAVDDVSGAADINYSLRLSQAVSGSNPFVADFSNCTLYATECWQQGIASINGNLIFSRLAGNAPDGPLTGIRIAFTAEDSDTVLEIGRNVDLDGCIPDCSTDPEDDDNLYSLLGEHEFRYGRMRLENAYGSDIPELDDSDDPIGRDIAIRVVAAYWDGSYFVTNEDDVATPYSSAYLGFVAGSYTDNLALSPASAKITPCAIGVSPDPDIPYRGIVAKGEVQGSDSNLDCNITSTNVPMYLQAPGEGNEGTVLLELDLNALGLGFLQYDWRTTGELEDNTQDGNYTDNPRAYIEFGAFHGNDRIINWQELFIERQ